MHKLTTVYEYEARIIRFFGGILIGPLWGVEELLNIRIENVDWL